ncbi:hypothetical protein KW783_03295 [Candidatus Parcubacteria bacterium]|nr:hypothetical protein [Candidatus Parcubacteria bacterium]
MSQRQSELLQSFFEMSLRLGGVIYTESGALHVNLGHTNPYSLFASVANRLGENPVMTFSRLKEMILQCASLYGCTAIIFHVIGAQYVKMEVTGKLDLTWLTVCENPACILPEFRGVQWIVSN